MEQQPDSSRTLDQMLREMSERVQRERGWRDINLGTTIGAGVATFTQNVALGSGTSVYQTQCPDCGSSNLASIAVMVDPKTDAPLGKRSILRTLATALLCVIIGLTVIILMSISTLDEAMGTEGIWIVALPIIVVNLFALGVLIAGAYIAVNGLIAALRKPNGYLRTCAVCGKQWI